RRADAADELTSKRSSKKTEGSNMNDKTKPAKTKPAKTRPAETKLAETKLAETKPAETKPAETKPADMWQQTKACADKNSTISAPALGGAAGTIVPGIGTVIGTIVAARIGFASSREKNVPVSGGLLPRSPAR